MFNGKRYSTIKASKPTYCLNPGCVNTPGCRQNHRVSIIQGVIIGGPAVPGITKTTECQYSFVVYICCLTQTIMDNYYYNLPKMSREEVKEVDNFLEELLHLHSSPRSTERAREEEADSRQAKRSKATL